jgi:hypothetical protein
MRMNNEQNTYDNEYFISIIMLFILQLQQKEKTNKMLEELDGELRQANRFFPNSELMEIIQSLSSISCLEMKKGTKLFRCRLVGKEEENNFLKPVVDAYISLVKNFVPDFDENAGMAEWLKFSVCFNDRPNEQRKWEKAHQQFIERYSGPAFWGYDEKNSDAPPPGRPAPGRINPDGISYLYVAEDIRTAILEVRPVPTQLISVAQIELTEDINVYSFAKPSSSDSDGENSILWTDYGEISNYFAIPNYGGKSYYLATQYISEYIKHMKNPEGQAMFDGLCFRSSLNPDGTNCVLFDVSDSRKYRICNSSLCKVKNLVGDFEYILPMSAPQNDE